MKHILRVPTAEQYAYIEFEFEGTAEDAIDEYRRLTALIKGGLGLPTKEFNRVLDEYLETGSIANGADLYAQMDAHQQAVLQEVKKSKKRRE